MARDSLRAVETTVRAQVTAEEDKLNVCGPQVQVVIFIEVSNSETLNTVEMQQTISERLNLPWNESEIVEKPAKFLVKGPGHEKIDFYCYLMILRFRPAARPANGAYLQLLTLSALPALENVIVAATPHHFQHIRKLTISSCPRLKNITWVLRLGMLERLVVTPLRWVAEQLKIVEEDSGDEAETTWGHPSNQGQEDEWTDNTRAELLNLRSIVLTDVRSLRSICKPSDFSQP
ncbi:hypothetical protein Zm00014a_035874 [Zea mays]|uniref:Disease resistance protein n=1 Tax=Zea mays TaxID=4577 RepID=A0A3L6GDY0_MAIZE|nr:hypothetical protein Zm00014a_035874 [Zea mays]